MSNYSKIYWLTRLDQINGFLTAALIIIAVVFVIYYIGRSISFDYDVDEFDDKFGKFKKPTFISAIIISLFLIFIPSKDDVIMMYAGGKTMDFVQSDSAINKIPAQTTKIISDYLDKKIKETETK